LELIDFKILNQFSLSYFKICGFNSFNQILLGLFNVLYAFEDCV